MKRQQPTLHQLYIQRTCRYVFLWCCKHNFNPRDTYTARVTVLSLCVCVCVVVIPIGTVVTAAAKVKKQSRGQGLILVLVEHSRTILKLSNSGQDVYNLHVCIAHSVVKCVWSNSQGPVCSAVKWSSNKTNFWTPVAAVTTAPMGVTCVCLLLNISLFTWLFVPQTILTFLAADKCRNFKRFSLKILRCEARAFPVSTATW